MSRREEKAAATRALFVNATFQCLVEAGYHGTTTVAVCERAKLARGTMLHHFPTKEALVLAALEDVLTRRVNDFQSELAGADASDLPGLVNHLWTALRGPTFSAWLELAVASRTDTVLQKEFRAVMGRFEELVSSAVPTLLPEGATGEVNPILAVSLVFSSLNGLALDLLQVDDAIVEAKVELLISWVSIVAASMQTSKSP